MTQGAQFKWELKINNTMKWPQISDQQISEVFKDPLGFDLKESWRFYFISLRLYSNLDLECIRDCTAFATFSTLIKLIGSLTKMLHLINQAADYILCIYECYRRQSTFALTKEEMPLPRLCLLQHVHNTFVKIAIAGWRHQTGLDSGGNTGALALLPHHGSKSDHTTPCYTRGGKTPVVFQ